MQKNQNKYVFITTIIIDFFHFERFYLLFIFLFRSTWFTKNQEYHTTNTFNIPLNIKLDFLLPIIK